MKIKKKELKQKMTEIEAEYTDGVLKINIAKKEEFKMASRHSDIK